MAPTWAGQGLFTFVLHCYKPINVFYPSNQNIHGQGILKPFVNVSAVSTVD